MLRKSKKRNPISYSIWFIPNGLAYDTLNRLIIKISKKYTNIKFSPHVTLLGGFLGIEEELRCLTKSLAKELSPFIINFDKIEYLDEFFRSIFIKVKLDNNFKNARTIAINNFQFEEFNFIPHLSLAYGALNEIMKKEIKFIAETGLYGVNSFVVDAIYLAKNDEINFKWEIIKTYKLNP